MRSGDSRNKKEKIKKINETKEIKEDCLFIEHHRGSNNFSFARTGNTANSDLKEPKNEPNYNQYTPQETL
jgi:hypothetical protein